jgi:hypothetical protein
LKTTDASDSLTANPSGIDEKKAIAIQSIDTYQPTKTPMKEYSWISDFSNGLDQFQISIDESVGCEKIPNSTSDINFYIIEEKTATKENQFSLELVANAENRPGIFVNAIAHRNLEFIDDRTYTFEGYFKKVEGSQPELININLDLVEDFEERYAEIIWGLNRFSSNYEWIYTRGPDFLEEKLFKLRNDTKWHYFKIVVEYKSSPKSRRIKSIQVDDQSQELDLEMGFVRKSWKSSFKILLETHNMYTNCDSKNNFIGISNWRDLIVTSHLSY